MVAEGLLAILVLVGLIGLGLPIGFAGAAVGIGGLFISAGPKVALLQLGLLPYSLSLNYNLLVIPLFLLMGNLAFEAGVMRKVFLAGRAWLSGLPGGLAMATVFGGAAFAAACGTSVASASALTRMCLPELDDAGYARKLSLGCIAAVGTLAMIIPPSSALVIYGVMTETSIARLLMAGILPGLLTAFAFGIVVLLWVKSREEAAPRFPSASWNERFLTMRGIMGLGFLMVVVLGGIYSGIFTPVEAAGLGAAGAWVLGLFSKSQMFRVLPEALRATIEATVAILTAIIGLLIFSVYFAYTGFPTIVAETIVGLEVSRYLVLAIVVLLLLGAGMFFEPVGIMVLTLPIIFPVMRELQFDPIWFGIILVKTCEIGMITPPVGMNCYVVKSIQPNAQLTDIFVGVAPFIIADLLVILILVLMPSIALVIPDAMYGVR